MVRFIAEEFNSFYLVVYFLNSIQKRYNAIIGNIKYMFNMSYTCIEPFVNVIYLLVFSRFLYLSAASIKVYFENKVIPN